MRAILRIALGGVYGFVCYFALLWLVSSMSPKLHMEPDEIVNALQWPLHVYLYVLPSQWARVSLLEGGFTVLGAALVLRGMYAAARKMRQPQRAAF